MKDAKMLQSETVELVTNLCGFDLWRTTFTLQIVIWSVVNVKYDINLNDNLTLITVKVFENY